MLHFFPASFPDETLFSRLARYHRLSGHQVDRESLQELVGLHTHVITSDLPSSLHVLVSRISGNSRLSTSEIIRSNTIFPYFAGFLPAERRSRAIETMSSTNTSGLKMSLGLIASRFGGKNIFRFCKTCVEEDRSSLGQAYWHRVHQLPGVWVCPHHREVVWELEPSMAQLKRHKLFLPDDSLVELNSRQFSLSPSQAEAVLRIALLSMHVMATQVCQEPSSLRDLYRARAEQNGLVRNNGRIRVAELANVLNHYSSRFPACGVYSTLHSRSLDWALKLLRKARGSIVHPIKHILLMDCLRDGCPQGSSPCTGGIAQADRPSVQRHSPVNEVKLAAMLRDEKYTLTRAAVELGLSVTTVCVEAARLGLPIHSRPKVLTPNVKERVACSIRQGLTLEDVAKAHHLSLASVYRILRMDPALAQDYVARSFEARRDAHRKRFASENRSKADYSWLRRNDKTWLAEQLAVTKPDVKRKPCVDWEARDKVLALRVVEISKTMSQLPGKPKWISRAALGRSVDKAETIERNAEKLPLTHAALSACAESLEEYQRRRIFWAARELQGQMSGPPSRWNLLRFAGIRVLAPGNETLIVSLTLPQGTI